MSNLVYEIIALMCLILSSVPIGTNRGLLTLMWALMSGRFLQSRGAVFPALSALGLAEEEVRRSEAALAYGHYCTQDLVSSWHQTVLEAGRWRPHSYEGIRPVACDLTGFFRARLHNCTTKHYLSLVEKSLPALVFGLCVSVGSVGNTRLGIPRLLLRRQPGEIETDLERRLLAEASAGLASEEALIVDGGFALADLRALENVGFVVRMAHNASARKNVLPAYCGKGTRPKWGVLVRALPRRYGKNKIPPTPPDKTVEWNAQGHTIKAHLYENLVAANERPGGKSYRLIVLMDPRYPKPLLVATNLSVSAEAVWHLYQDRWPIEQLPLAAKQILGAERSFVSGHEARYRLPELALLAGNLLSYVAGMAPTVPTGFWDRHSRPTCGRLRRYLERLNFLKLTLPEGQLRKKASITDHLLKGVLAHRRQKASQQSGQAPIAA
jgi:hypothetical protein